MLCSWGPSCLSPRSQLSPKWSSFRTWQEGQQFSFGWDHILQFFFMHYWVSGFCFCSGVYLLWTKYQPGRCDEHKWSSFPHVHKHDIFNCIWSYQCKKIILPDIVHEPYYMTDSIFVQIYTKELPILLREHFNGMYRIDVYYLSKQIAEMPIYLIIPVMFTTIFYPMVGLAWEWLRFFNCLCIILLLVQAALSFGIMIGCLVSTTEFALAIAPPCLVPLLLLGGFFLNAL